MPIVREYCDKKPVIPVLCVFNNSSDLTDDDACKLNEAARVTIQTIFTKANELMECDVKVSVLALAGNRMMIVDSLYFEDFIWEDFKPEGKARWDEAAMCMDDLLFENIKSSLGDIKVYAPIVLFFMTSKEIYSLKNMNLNKSRDVKSIALKLLVTPEKTIECHESIDLIDCVVSSCDIDMLNQLITIGDIDVLKQHYALIKRFYPSADGSLSETVKGFVMVDSLTVGQKKKGEEALTEGGFVVTYPSKGLVEINGNTEIKRCQITSCSPKNAQDVVLKLEDEGDWLLVTNVSEMPLVATFTVSSLECRRIPHDSTDSFEILANPNASSKLSLAVKVDFDTFGYMSITNNSDFDISVRHTIGSQGMYLRQDDYVTIGEGIQILKVIKGGKVANDWDNWDWD